MFHVEHFSAFAMSQESCRVHGADHTDGVLAFIHTTSSVNEHQFGNVNLKMKKHCNPSFFPQARGLKASQTSSVALL